MGIRINALLGKGLMVLALLCTTCISEVQALHVTIVESQSYLNTDVMDTHWQSIVTLMGHTATIVPQTTLDNSAFFSGTDVLIVSSGSIALPANRVNTILQFLQTGKPVYLQGEYQCSLSTNQAFEYLVNTLGGTFSWGGITNGIFSVNIMGSFATTQLPTTQLSYFNFGCHGTGCGIQYFLERLGQFYGYFFCSAQPNTGRLIQVTDQDWINNNTNDTLMQNIITHLTDPVLGSISTFTPLNLGHDTTLCNGSTMTLNATSSNATYLWQNGSTTPTFTVNTAGTYWVQVSNNCGVFSDTIHIAYVPSPTVHLGNDSMPCAGHVITLHATYPGATYLWQDGSTDSTLDVMFSGIYSVQVKVGNCEGRDTIVLNFTPAPLLNLGPDTVLCSGDVLWLDATSLNATYLWQDGSSNPTYMVQSPGWYKVRVTTPCGMAYDSIHVGYLTPQALHLGADTTLCEGDTLVLHAQVPGATGYTWSDQSHAPDLPVSTAGLYWAEVQEGPCVVRDSISLAIQSRPEVHLGNDVKLCSDQTLVLNATTDKATYLWQDQSVNPTYTVTKKGLYWVQVDVNGCYGGDTIAVDYYTESCDCSMFLPNAFSPNGDGRNDEYRFIASTGNIDLLDFIIYDRWGRVAFATKAVYDSWNGHIKGGEADMGTYYYYVHYRCRFTGQEFTLKGDLLLIR